MTVQDVAVSAMGAPALTGWHVERHAPHFGVKQQKWAVVGLELVALMALPFLVPPPRFANAVLFSAIVGMALLARVPERPILRLTTTDGLHSLVISAGLGGVGVLLVRGPEGYPGLWQLTSYAGLVIFTILPLRAITYAVLRRMRRLGSCDPGVVIGAGADVGRLVESAREHPQFGVRLIGTMAAPKDPDSLRSHLAQSSARLAFVLEGTEAWVIRAAAAAGTKVFLVPSSDKFMSRNYVMDDSVWRMAVTPLHTAGVIQRSAKRMLDVVVSGSALIVLLPLLAFIGVRITRETGGSMMFRQERVGQGGRTFELLKFQTMVPADESESRTKWNVAADDRLRPFGRFLRRTSLDELPQLINILRGDMSLVGPRPERPHFVAEFSKRHPHYADRHRVPVGLTGWAQIHRLRGDTSIEDRAYLDNMYADRWSLAVDLKVLMRTVPEVLRRSGG